MPDLSELIGQRKLRENLPIGRTKHAEFSASYLKQKLKGSSRPIKTALLDQALVAGAGNILSLIHI